MQEEDDKRAADGRRKQDRRAGKVEDFKGPDRRTSDDRRGETDRRTPPRGK